MVESIGTEDLEYIQSEVCEMGLYAALFMNVLAYTRVRPVIYFPTTFDV